MKTLKQLRKDFERSQIIERLHDLGWNVKLTAISLGIERAHLHRIIAAYKIKRAKLSKEIE